jgi:glycosyl transferase, family 25
VELLSYFDRTYIINLPERKDRRLEMQSELRAAEIPEMPGRLEFFSAIRPTEPAGFPNLGVRGCFLSHLAIYRAARDLKLARVLIMEDDLAFSRRFRGELAGLCDQLGRQDWDFAYFGHILNVSNRVPAEFVPYQGPIGLTHFYALSGRVLDRLITFFELVMSRPSGHPEGGIMFNDAALSVFREQNPDVLTLVSSPSLGFQRSSRSDLTSSWYDKVPGLRRATSVARSVKSRLRGRD